VTALLLDAYQDWACPNCTVTERVRPPLPANAQRWHACPGLHMLKAPLVIAGTDCKVVAVEREDYLRDECQRTGDDGKPYMAVETVHADGHTDRAVFAPAAYAATARR
jgi:hypothetical protein